MSRLLSLAPFLFAGVLALPLDAADPVKVEQGQLAGTTTPAPEVHVYKGIPYAAPPVGDLRWAPPKPPAPWKGVRAATAFGNACPQTPYPTGSVYFREAEPMSEDCLYLNIWTVAQSSSENRPVMVWIHGGALTRGSGSLPTYDGTNLARHGMVVVTVNYRLGVLGYFAHPELSGESDRHASGNYGVLDQIAALQWVKKNIAAFGGDPARVTIFGESAGSWSVNLLVASPLAKGLFQRAIGESGAQFSPMRRLSDVEQAGARLGGSIAALRAKSADELLKTPWSTGPVVDGWAFPQDVYTIFARGKQNDVPLLAGSNSDEATSLAPWPPTANAAAFIAQARRAFGDSAEEFLKVYPASTDPEAEASHYASFRDQTFTWQMRAWVRMQTSHGKSKAWLYQFTRVPPGPQSARLRAFHASEIAYVFGNLDSERPWEGADRELSSQMISYWTNFATRGDPNGRSLPAWPAYDEKSDRNIVFGDKIATADGLNRDALDFFDRYYAKQRAATAAR
jgi:para-nitrobenzyl esterase